MIQWPLARSEGLLVESVGDEIVVYDEETKEAHCLKALAATVFEYADGSRTTSDIAELAGRRLGTPVSEPNVSDAVAQLEHAGLLKVPLLVRDGNGGGVSRREAMRRFGLAGAAAAAATPLITSIVAPTAAMAQSGLPIGCPCGKNKDCISGHCCQTNAGKSCNQQCCVATANSCHLVSSTCVGGTNAGNPCTVDTDCPGGTCSRVCGVCATDFGTGGCGSQENCPTGTPCQCVSTC